MIYYIIMKQRFVLLEEYAIYDHNIWSSFQLGVLVHLLDDIVVVLHGGSASEQLLKVLQEIRYIVEVQC